MAIAFAVLVLLIGVALIALYVMSIEQYRKSSIRQTIIDSGRKDLTSILAMYPAEMYDEVTEEFRKLHAGSSRRN